MQATLIKATNRNIAYYYVFQLDINFVVVLWLSF